MSKIDVICMNDIKAPCVDVICKVQQNSMKNIPLVPSFA